MVNINYQQENTACDISKKNILRRESCELIGDKNMGGQHGHLLHEIHQRGSDVVEALEGQVREKFIKRYDVNTILALRDDPLSKVKPSCADDRPFWINGKSYGHMGNRTKKIDRGGRIGSGRLSTGDNFTPPSTSRSTSHYPPQYNPVNHDHRRLLHENREEKLPEWVNAGPTSRFDTIDLHGFHDDKNSSSGSGTGSKESESGDTKDLTKKFGKSFSFDEFLGSQGSGMNYCGQDSYSSFNNQNQGQSSRFKRYFNNNNKNRNFSHHFQQHPQQQNAPPGFPPIQRPSNVGQARHFQPKFDSNNNEAATALLELLHRQSGLDQYKQSNFNFASSNNSMPLASDLEAARFHNNRVNAERQRQFEQNKAMLAGKSIVDVIGVLSKSQLRANAMPFNNNTQSYQWNQQQQQHYNPQRNRSCMSVPTSPTTSSYMKSNNQMNHYQMARVLERQMMVQGQNPMYGGLTPQDPEYWEKIRQQQESFYQQYERNNANRQVKVKFPGNGRHVKFEEKPILDHFFNSHHHIGDLPTIDPEKTIKVEEFERKIKQGASAYKQHKK